MRLWGLALIAVACGGPDKPRAKRGIASSDAAIFAFQSQWAKEIRPRIADPLVRRIDNRMQEVDTFATYTAESRACREGIDRIALLENVRQGTVEQSGTLVMFGSPDALLGRDRCWSVLFLGGLPALDAEGWLDTTGRLLIAWRIPESG